MIQIEYRLSLPDQKSVHYQLTLDDRTGELLDNTPPNLPEWAALEFNQCPHCPLSVKTSPSCPLATRLVNIIVHFDRLMSYDRISLEVITERRIISRETSVQDALSSIMGLVIPTSGCPHTAYFRPMARYHLPLADTNETIYRATSMYLLSQYYRHKNGKSVDLEFNGLKEIYRNMQILNAAIADRLRAASKSDSSVNALILLDMFALALPYAIEESLEEMRHLFLPFLTGE